MALIQHGVGAGRGGDDPRPPTGTPSTACMGPGSLLQLLAASAAPGSEPAFRTRSPLGKAAAEPSSSASPLGTNSGSSLGELTVKPAGASLETRTGPKANECPAGWSAEVTENKDTGVISRESSVYLQVTTWRPRFREAERPSELTQPVSTR